MAKDWCDIRRGCIDPKEYAIALAIILAFLYFAYTTPFDIYQLLLGMVFLLFLVEYFSKQLRLGGISLIVFLIQWGVVLYLCKRWLIDRVEIDMLVSVGIVLAVVALLVSAKKRCDDR